MLRFVFSAFIVLHGLVHLLYFGQSQRLFELRPGMVWPDGSWAFSELFGDEATRLLASIAFLLAATGFVAGGIGVLVGHAWWRFVIVSSAVFSSAIILLFWDGKVRKLDHQGLIALLINMAILVALILRWPNGGVLRQGSAHGECLIGGGADVCAGARGWVKSAGPTLWGSGTPIGEAG